MKPATKTCHKLELSTFAEPTACQKCSKYLKGRINQGYKCSACGINVHKECIVMAGKCVISPVGQAVSPPPAPSKLINKLWYAFDF